MIICQGSLNYTHKFQKYTNDKGIKSGSNAPNNKLGWIVNTSKPNAIES